MKYYYLKDTDIIQEGDEWFNEDFSSVWQYVGPSIGSTLRALRKINTDTRKNVVRRKIKVTKLGNTL